MSYTLILKPCSTQTVWALSLLVEPGVRRFDAAFLKIGRTFYAAQRGALGEMCELYEWYLTMRKLEGYFTRESKRLAYFIAHKFPEKIEFPPLQPYFSYAISNPVSVYFFQLLCAYDHLMCLAEFCITVRLIAKRRIMRKKLDRYKQELIQLMTRISQFQPGTRQITTVKDRLVLMQAIVAEHMPILNGSKFEGAQQIAQGGGVK